jgi:hypothetical protein
MKRAAIQSVGLLDSIYGKGYGEECDWSRKAVSQGWHHLISTRAFVYHSGTQSFKSETKKRAIQQNSLILNRRFPEYDFEVASYVRKDPLWLARIEICLTLLIKNKKTDSLITLEIVQNEPPLLTLKGACAGAFTFQERFHPHCLPLLLTFLKTYGAQVQILQEKLAPLSDQETTQANLAQKMRTEILLIDQISKERDQLLEQLTQLGGANSLLFKFMAKLKRILDRYPLFKSMLRNTITLSWRLAQKARL